MLGCVGAPVDTNQREEVPPLVIGPGSHEGLVRPNLERLVNDQWLPSAAVVIVTPTETEFYGFGETQVGNHQAPNAHTPFEIGSVTKTFTATALAREIERHNISLEQTMASLVDYRVPDYQGQPITVLDVITHGSGLPRTVSEYIRDPADQYANFGVPELENWLQRYRLPRAPGAEFEYSNVAIGWLAHVLADRSSLPYHLYIQREVFGPLHMQESWVASAETEEQQSHMPTPYDSEMQRTNRLTFTEAMTGAGAIISTGSDMARYMRAQLGLERGALSSAIELTHGHHRSYNNGPDFGLAWIHEPHGRISHSGLTSGFVTQLYLNLELQIGVLVFANSDDTWGNTHDVSVGLMDRLSGGPGIELHAPRPGQDDAAVADKCIGDYTLPYEGMTLPIQMYRNSVDGRLYIRGLSTAGDAPLTPNQPGAYFSRSWGLAALCENLVNDRFTTLHVVLLSGEEYRATR